MRAYHAAFVVLTLACCASAHSQQELQHPDQFYSNGTKTDGWTRNEPAGLRSTFWFAKNPKNSLSYRQQVVIVYDAEPNQAYYYDSTTKKFIGRFDLEVEKYSMLPEHARKSRLHDIDRSAFPRPGAMPTIGEMLAEGQPGIEGNPDKMMMAPPTMKFPRFEKSSWDTNYVASGGSRVRATVDFNGNRGTYRLVNQDTFGQLSDVKYDMREDDFIITGRWSLGRSTGYFRFTIPSDNMDVFWGDWGFQRDRVHGTWDGMRKPR